MNRTLLERARAIVAAQPSDRVKLAFVASKSECGSQACVLGHCAMDPEFQALGLGLDFDRGLYAAVTYLGEEVDYSVAGAAVFGIDPLTAVNLFKPTYTGTSEYTDFAGDNRAIALHRLDTFLAEHV